MTTKWNYHHKKILDFIKKIGYFNSIRCNTDNIEKELDKIKAKTLQDRLINKTLFHDKTSKTMILFLSTSGKCLEIMIQCYKNKSNDFKHIVEQKTRVLKFLKEYKNPNTKKLGRKLRFKIIEDRIRIGKTQMLYKKTNKLDYRVLLGFYSTTIALLINYLRIILLENSYINENLFLVILSFFLNLSGIIIFKYFGGKENAYFPK